MNEPIQEGKPIYVFQLPIRIWHWSMVLSFLVLIPTGYIIGKPWHSLDGDPTYLFYMGYTRMAHFIAGFIITIGLLWRIIFAFFGNKYSRQVFIIRSGEKAGGWTCCRTSAGTCFSTGPRASTSGTIRWPSSA